MFGFLKRHTPFLAFSLCFILVAHCFAVTGTVSVTVTPGHQTVKTRGAGVPEEIGINTAEYTIAASCDPQVETGEEVKPVEPSWTIASEIVFLPPKDVDPVPEDPGTLSVSISGDDGDWTTKVHSSAAGEWKITFTATVTYKLWDTVTDDYARDDKGNILTVPFSGEGTCRFKATGGNFRIVLLPDDNFQGRSLSTLGVGETGSDNPNDPLFAGKIYVEPIGNTLSTDIFPLQEFSSSDDVAFTMRDQNLDNGTAKFTAGIAKRSTVVTAKDKNGNSETYAIEILEPQGVRFEEYEKWRNGVPGRRPAIFGSGTVVVCVPIPDLNRGAAVHNKMYVIPTEVSFVGVSFSEDGCSPTQYEGTLIDPNVDEPNHPAWNSPGIAGRGDINLGCRIGGPSLEDPERLPGTIDTACFIRDSTPGDGKLIWDIPWTYHVKNSPDRMSFMPKMRQEMKNIGDKKSSVSKNGITVERTIP